MQNMTTNTLTPTILYEDDNILAINKPAGLVVHPDGKSDVYTLCDWLIKKYPQIKNVGEHLKLSDENLIPRPGIVHRLDKDTSGVMLVAKTQEGFMHLKHQFKNRSISKAYHAFVYGNIKVERKTIDWPMGRSKGNIRRWTVEKFARGKIREAVTQVRVLKRFKFDGQMLSFIEARPLTGRTHQIRVHLNAIYHPIVSDSLYAPKNNKTLGFERHALHAFRIVFKNTKGKEITVTAPYPDDFQKALESAEYNNGII